MRSGIFKGKFDCSKCKSNPNFKKTWGCENEIKFRPLPSEEINGIRYVYHNCLFKFIPDSIFDFITIDDYYSDFSGAQMPFVENVSGRFLLAHKIYNRWLHKFQEEEQKQ